MRGKVRVPGDFPAFSRLCAETNVVDLTPAMATPERERRKSPLVLLPVEAYGGSIALLLESIRPAFSRSAAKTLMAEFLTAVVEPPSGGSDARSVSKGLSESLFLASGCHAFSRRISDTATRVSLIRSSYRKTSLWRKLRTFQDQPVSTELSSALCLDTGSSCPAYSRLADETRIAAFLPELENPTNGGTDAFFLAILVSEGLSMKLFITGSCCAFWRVDTDTGIFNFFSPVAKPVCGDRGAHSKVPLKPKEVSVAPFPASGCPACAILTTETLTIASYNMSQSQESLVGLGASWGGCGQAMLMHMLGMGIRGIKVVAS